MAVGMNNSPWSTIQFYAVPTISRLLKITGLLCKRALQMSLYSAKETSNLKGPTNRSHPISRFCATLSQLSVCSVPPYQQLSVCSVQPYLQLALPSKMTTVSFFPDVFSVVVAVRCAHLLLQWGVRICCCSELCASLCHLRICLSCILQQWNVSKVSN